MIWGYYMSKEQKSHQKKIREKRVSPSYFNQLNPYVASSDSGSRSHFVAAPVMKEKGFDSCVREFSSFTPDLKAMADWLKTCNVTSVVMESTSVYRIPFYE